MKQLLNTKATVRLRKAEERKEWYVYIESYPVLDLNVIEKYIPPRIHIKSNNTNMMKYRCYFCHVFIIV